MPFEERQRIASYIVLFALIGGAITFLVGIMVPPRCSEFCIPAVPAIGSLIIFVCLIPAFILLAVMCGVYISQGSRRDALLPTLLLSLAFVTLGHGFIRENSYNPTLTANSSLALATATLFIPPLVAILGSIVEIEIRNQSIIRLLCYLSLLALCVLALIVTYIPNLFQLP